MATHSPDTTDEPTHETLADITGTGTELITVYLPADRSLHSVRAALRNEAQDAQNIKSKRTRKRVQQALTLLDSELTTINAIPENGLVLFAGVVETDTDTEEILHTTEPATPIDTYRYHCDSSFLVDPLETLQDDRPILGLLLVDVGEAHIGVLHGTTVVHLESLSSYVPPKHRQGGQSAPRFQRRRDEAIGEFYRTVGAAATRLFDEYTDSFVGLTIGGPLLSRDAFSDGSYIGHQFTDDILGVYSVDTVSEQALHTLADHSIAALEDHTYERQRESLSEFKQRLRDNTAIYGADETKHAAELGAIDTLLVATDSPDKELLETVTEYGGTIVELNLNLEEASQFHSVFGDYGALLRFEVSSPPNDRSRD